MVKVAQSRLPIASLLSSHHQLMMSSSHHHVVMMMMMMMTMLIVCDSTVIKGSNWVSFVVESC